MGSKRIKLSNIERVELVLRKLGNLYWNVKDTWFETVKGKLRDPESTVVFPTS